MDKPKKSKKPLKKPGHNEETIPNNFAQFVKGIEFLMLDFNSSQIKWETILKA